LGRKLVWLKNPLGSKQVCLKCLYGLENPFGSPTTHPLPRPETPFWRKNLFGSKTCLAPKPFGLENPLRVVAAVWRRQQAEFRPVEHIFGSCEVFWTTSLWTAGAVWRHGLFEKCSLGLVEDRSAPQQDPSCALPLTTFFLGGGQGGRVSSLAAQAMASKPVKGGGIKQALASEHPTRQRSRSPRPSGSRPSRGGGVRQWLGEPPAAPGPSSAATGADDWRRYMTHLFVGNKVSGRMSQEIASARPV